MRRRWVGLMPLPRAARVSSPVNSIAWRSTGCPARVSHGARICRLRGDGCVRESPAVARCGARTSQCCSPGRCSPRSRRTVAPRPLAIPRSMMRAASIENSHGPGPIGSHGTATDAIWGNATHKERLVQRLTDCGVAASPSLPALAAWSWTFAEQLRARWPGVDGLPLFSAYGLRRRSSGGERSGSAGDRWQIFATPPSPPPGPGRSGARRTRAGSSGAAGPAPPPPSTPGSRGPASGTVARPAAGWVPELQRHERGLLDTSVLIDLEEVDATRLPLNVAVSSSSLAELAAGPHDRRRG